MGQFNINTTFVLYLQQRKIGNEIES